MNKFNINSKSLIDTLMIAAIIAISVWIASFISGTPRYISVFVVSIFFFVCSIYLFFFENKQDVLDKYLAKTAVLTLYFSLGAVLSYYDWVWFDIS